MQCTIKMIDTLTYNTQPESWLYEIKQKGHNDTCYVMVPHARVGFTSHYLFICYSNLFSFSFWSIFNRKTCFPGTQNA